MQIDRRSGRHYPLQAWSDWRDGVVTQLRSQDLRRQSIDSPCNAVIHYTSGDKRRRDLPGLLDALWHCLERAEVLVDDRWIVNLKFVSFYDAGRPNVKMWLF